MTSPPRKQRQKAAFTLIELMAVVVLTAAVLAVAVNFYLQISRSSQAAVARASRSLRAAFLLDRIARDLDGTVLIKRPPGTDPLADPWLFLADSDGAGPADHLKFQTRANRPTADDLPISDLATVSWWLASGPDGQSELLRGALPGLPDQLDKSFPRSDADGVAVLARGIASFSVRLEDDKGDWNDAWDSSTVARDGTLPLAVEISVSWPPEPGDSAPETFSRRVLLPLQPLDLQAALGGPGGQNGQGQGADRGQDQGASDQAGDQQQSCITVGQCISRNAAVYQQFLQSRPDRAAVQSVVNSLSNQCFSAYAGQIAALGISVQGCQ